MSLLYQTIDISVHNNYCKNIKTIIINHNKKGDDLISITTQLLPKRRIRQLLIAVYLFGEVLECYSMLIPVIVTNISVYIEQMRIIGASFARFCHKCIIIHNINIFSRILNRHNCYNNIYKTFPN